MKGQIQSYLSNPDSMIKLPSVAGERKMEKKEESKKDESYFDLEMDSGRKIEEERRVGSEIKIPGEIPHGIPRKISADEFRKMAIMNNAKLSHEKKEEEKPQENVKIKVSRV